MTRLPQPGQDDGTWGDILNNFLAVEHNSDGTLKASGSLTGKVDTSDARLSNQRVPSDGSVTIAKIASGGIAATAITGTALTANVRGAANGVASLDGSGAVPASQLAGAITVVNAGTNTGAVRPSGALVVYWLCANGVTPSNAMAGDLIYQAS